MLANLHWVFVSKEHAATEVNASEQTLKIFPEKWREEKQSLYGYVSLNNALISSILVQSKPFLFVQTVEELDSEEF